MGSNPTISSRVSYMKSISHFYSYRTYSGCLEGVPPLESTYNSIRNQAKKLWGMAIPIYIMEPIIQVIPKKHHFGPYEMLPAWTHMVWADGSAKDSENHGSHLVIVWFSEEPIVSVSDIVDKVDWAAHAEDFQY